MAVTITAAEVAVAIRAATSADSVPAPIATVLGFLVPAGAAMVLRHAPEAPDALHNAALIRLAGWLYDADPTDSRLSDALSVSGAANLLAQWRVHRAGLIDSDSDPTPTPGGGGNVPQPPSSGLATLVAVNGVIQWSSSP